MLIVSVLSYQFMIDADCFSAILASRVLKERLNLLGKVGCMLCVLGSTVMVIHSPKEQEVANIDQLKAMVAEPGVCHVARENQIFILILLVCCLVNLFDTELSPERDCQGAVSHQCHQVRCLRTIWE